MPAPRVTATGEAPTFDPAWFSTVFVVPDPPPSWPVCFAVVTAHNPGGLPATSARNAEADRELDDVLVREGFESFVVIGASPDLAHQEAGRAFAATDVATAARISARFGQHGFFWIEGGKVFACVDASGRGWELGPWAARVVSPRR